MLMKKLPDESLKKKWVDRAVDPIQRKGRAEYADFVEFVGRVAGRINNRYEQELTSSCLSERDRKESSKGKSDCQSRVTTLATRSDRSQRSSDTQHRAPQKCAQCSGLHGVWRCRVFRSAPLSDRLKTVPQHRLCRICLEDGHSAKQCSRGFTCRISGCGKDHHYLIHSSGENIEENCVRDNNRNTPGSSASTSNAQEPVTELHSSQAPTMAKPANPVASPVVSESRTLRSSDSVAVCSVRASRPRVCFKVVPVKISCRGNTKEITTYAFLDGGSDATLC